MPQTKVAGGGPPCRGIQKKVFEKRTIVNRLEDHDLKYKMAYTDPSVSHQNTVFYLARFFISLIVISGPAMC